MRTLLQPVRVHDISHELVGESGGEAEAFVVDLADPTQASSLVGRVLDRFGRIDILVNGAGMPDTGSVLDGALDVWERAYRVNVTAPFLLMQAVGRHMIARGGGGRIVNLSSSSGFRAHAGAAYGSSKAAIAALSRIAAAELAQHDINVNAVAPGLTRTPMVTDALDAASLQAAVESGPMANFFQRPSDAEDIAAAVLFLCLPASRQMTAQTLHVSAGLVIS